MILPSLLILRVPPPLPVPLPSVLIVPLAHAR